MKQIAHCGALGACLALALLAGCGGTSVRTSDGGGPAPAPDGSFPDPLINQNAGFEIATDGSGFAYRTGQRVVGGPFVGEAAIIPGTEVGAPATGNVSYAGRYEIAAVGMVPGPDDTTIGLNRQLSGPITLVADFADRSLTGASGNLVVNGTINGNTVSGGISFEGISADLTGVAGRDRVVGAFAGAGADRVFAGGFMAED